MSTLVIGGNGLVGTKLVEYLCGIGENVISYSLHKPQKEVKGCTYVRKW